MSKARELGRANERFAGDLGEADPITRSLMAAGSDPTSYVRALVALCTSRFLLPVVASTVTEEGERRTDLSGVTYHHEGQVYCLAFTGIDALRSWDPTARPVPCHLDELAVTALESGASKILLDLAGPHPFVIEDDVVTQFSQGFALVEFADHTFGWVAPHTSESREPNNGPHID